MNQTLNPNPPTFPTLCGQCGIDEPKFLHNIRQRSNFRRLCTTCVLRLHPQFFCPVCLAVFDRTPPIDAVVCYKCYSCSHSTCVPSSRCPSPCSSCLNPNSLVLNLNRLENGGISGNGGRVIDGNAASLLLAAAKIAAMSMSKAEVAAGMEAERRAKEAAYTKKRAKEALDHVVSLMRREKRNAVVVESGKKVSNVVAVPAVVVDADGDAGKCKGDASSEVVEALNAVELKDEGRRVESVVNEPEAQVNGAVGMELDVVGGKDSTDENGSVKTDDLAKIGENGQEMEKNHAVVENSVGNSKD